MLEPAEVMIDGCGAWMIRTQGLFYSRQRPSVESLRLVEISRILVEHGQVIEDRHDFEMVGAKDRCREGQRLPVERLGLRVLRSYAAGIGRAKQGADACFLLDRKLGLRVQT